MPIEAYTTLSESSPGISVNRRANSSMNLCRCFLISTVSGSNNVYSDICSYSVDFSRPTNFPVQHLLINS